LTSVKSFSGFLKGSGGISDFSFSESELVVAFMGLSFVELVMGSLFGGDGGLEFG